MKAGSWYSREIQCQGKREGLEGNSVWGAEFPTQLVEEVFTYLDGVAKEAAQLPLHYPSHVSWGGSTAAGIKTIEEGSGPVRILSGFGSW